MIDHKLCVSFQWGRACDGSAEVLDPDVMMDREILCHEPAVTMIGLFFAAEQTVRVAQLLCPGGFDSPILHQLKKFPFVLAPFPSMFLVRIQHLLCRGKEWNVSILDGTNFVKEVCEILFLGKASKLGDIVEANIDNACDACGA
jgi:hypothetical protein